MRHALGSLAAAVLAASLLASPADPAHANGSVSVFENHPDVRMFTPTPLVYRSDRIEPPAVRPVEVEVHVLLDALALDREYRAALDWTYRKDLIHRVMGHRYTGFIKMYRGPRYPF